MVGFGVKGAHRLGSYIAKYCGKVMDCLELNQKRYFRSRGIVLPTLQYWRLPNCTCMLDAVHAAFRMIEGHAMENLDSAITRLGSCIWRRLQEYLIILNVPSQGSLRL